MKLQILLTAVVAVGWCGCAKPRSSAASRLVETDTLRAMLRQAAAVAHTEWRENLLSSGGGVDHGARQEIGGEVDEAARARLLTALRLATRQLLAEQGATLYGWEKRGNDDNLNGFSWNYSWQENNGLMQVRYYPGPAGRGQLALFSIEYRRDGPPPGQVREY